MIFDDDKIDEGWFPIRARVIKLSRAACLPDIAGAGRS